MRTVICYDVADDKRRREVVKALETCAMRVQESVFEARDLDPAGYLRMRSRVERVLRDAEDGVRYHRLCAACLERIEHFGVGVGVLPPPEGFKLV